MKTKSRHLTPTETENVIHDYDYVLPNFLRDEKDLSYFFVKELPENRLSIVQVIEDGKKLRVKNGGFETPKGRYYKKEAQLKKDILEGRREELLLLVPFIGQLGFDSDD